MTKLLWDSSGNRIYETGVDRGVLAVNGGDGVAWSGLSSVTEKPSGGDTRTFYLDSIPYFNLPSYEDFEATIKAFTYPDEFRECEGTSRLRYGLFLTQQNKKSFDLSYRSMVGNDLESLAHGYKIHIVYNAIAEASDIEYRSLSSSSDPILFSWDLVTLPPEITGFKNSAHIYIDSRFTNSSTLTAIEEILYGTDEVSSRIPTIDEIIEVYEEHATLRVIDNGDGTADIIGPDEIVVALDSDSYSITWDSVININATTYQISSH